MYIGLSKTILAHCFNTEFEYECHLPLQEVDIFDNKLEFSEIKIAIGQGFLVVQLQSSFKVT